MSKREVLAAYAHDAWAGWMRYLFKLSQENEDGSVTIPAEAVARWLRQTATAYVDLPQDEQASDQAEADKIIAILELPDDAPLKYKVHSHGPNTFYMYECEHLSQGTAYGADGFVLNLGEHANLLLCKHCTEHVIGQVNTTVLREAIIDSERRSRTTRDFIHALEKLRIPTAQARAAYKKITGQEVDTTDAT